MKIELTSKLDATNKPFFLGFEAHPGTLSFKKGVVFFVFTSDPGFEQMEIKTPKPGTTFGSVRRQVNDDTGELERIIIPLKKKPDIEGDIIYIGFAQSEDIELDLSAGVSFVVFTSRPGAEELQINLKRRDDNRRSFDRRDNKSSDSGQHELRWPSRHENHA